MYIACYGCWPFTLALWAGPAAVLCGLAFSFFQTNRRLQDYWKARFVLGINGPSAQEDELHGLPAQADEHIVPKTND